MTNPATPAWLGPTARAVPWQPLLGVAVCMIGVVALATVRGSWPVGMLDVAAAGMAAAVVAGLRDDTQRLELERERPAGRVGIRPEVRQGALALPP